MDELDHDLDPEGDLILVLRNIRPPSETFGNVHWRSSSRHGTSESDGEQSMDEALPHDANTETVPHNDEEARALYAGTALNEAIDDFLLDSPSSETSDKQMRVRVSSKHLALASHVLKSMLPASCRTRTEAHQNAPELLLLNDQPAPLLILLNLIHGKYRDVPRKLDLVTLAEISILVDYYSLHGTVEIMADQWLQNLDTDVPETFDESLLQWMCISWVFDWRDKWNKATLTAQWHSDRLLSEELLPIPNSALNSLDNFRQKTLFDIFEFLQDAIKLYKANKVCVFRCDALLLGALTIGLEELGILIPPKPPFNGVSLREVFDGLRALDLPQMCREQRKYAKSSGMHCESFSRTLGEKIEELQGVIAPVELEWKMQKFKPGLEARLLKVQTD